MTAVEEPGIRSPEPLIASVQLWGVVSYRMLKDTGEQDIPRVALDALAILLS